MTVKKLKEILSTYEDDIEISDEQNQDLRHIFEVNDRLVLSHYKPIGTCNRTGEFVFPTKLEDYEGFCPALDEDLYSFEFTPIKD